MRSLCSTLISSYPQRHWYQGDYSELDPETGLQAFDLRMYSSRIGRWLSVDPYAQYWSPYLAMGNNPVGMVDPDGGFDICPTCPGGSQFDVYRNSEHHFYYDDGIVSNFDPVNINSTRLYDGGGIGFFGQFVGFVDKHFNGGLGYTGVAVKAYNGIPNNVKRHYAHKLSKSTGWKSGKIFQNTKSFVNGTGKFASRLGPASSVLSGVVITYDLLDDGSLKSSSIVNGTLLAAGLIFPATAPFIIGYGILDYTFDISSRLDRNFGTVNTGIYD
jgi:RHS repeat-associated protein